MSTPDPYRVVPAASARRDLRRLPAAVAAACYEFIDTALVGNPRRVGKPLRTDLAGLYSANRGAYRIIYRIDEDQHTIQVVRIAHRSDVYRPH